MVIQVVCALGPVVALLGARAVCGPGLGEDGKIEKISAQRIVFWVVSAEVGFDSRKKSWRTGGEGEIRGT